MTRLLHAASRGEPDALDEVFPLVYGELQRLARKVRSGRAGDTLNTTALVHEAYLKLVRTDDVAWNGRQHFFRVAARAMRQVLVRDATRRQTAKRGGGQAPVELNETMHGAAMADDDVLALDEALGRLEALDARQAAVVEIRFFTGLTLEETAETLGVSVPTVSRDWRMARVWLARALAA
ncbi:ECF-type sigma factor [Rubrivirga sp. SAORIC476]|uniref:ECF-type sigma factor n=1 Tax=Rubrivirga sp. SAORIC476 TaxID=1961794 RepID=UPI0018E9EBC7|nr:ECF-type sigma factor [Rubrivirga sp. SAORIC476]